MSSQEQSSSGETERPCLSAAAYVLGALSPAERADFESHLPTCAECRQGVNDLAGIPGLLARVSPDDLVADPPVPATLLPRLLRNARRANRRRRFATVLAAAAAVVVAVLGTVLVFDGQGSNDAPEAGPTATMTQVVDSPVHATAALQARKWGTQVVLHCRYEEGYGAARPYALVVIGQGGTSEQVATWSIGPGRTARVIGSSDLSPAQIEAVEIRTAGGTTLLRLDN